MHIKYKSCNFKFLGKLVVQHDIKASFDGRLQFNMNPNSIYIYLLEINLSLQVQVWTHLRKNVKEYDMHIEPKY